LNEQNSAYLRGLEQEFGDGSNAIRLELNRMQEAGLLLSEGKGNKKYFAANIKHPMFSDIQSIVRKYVGIDVVLQKVVQKIGNLSQVYVSGKMAKGLDDAIIELLFVGDAIDTDYLHRLCRKAEGITNRKISFVVFNPTEFENYRKQNQNTLLLIFN
jgi:hypothetical protein